MDNGTKIDLGTLYRLLQEISYTTSGYDTRFSEIDRRLDDVIQKIERLERAVATYRASTLAHGMMLSELDNRVRRIEQASIADDTIGRRAKTPNRR
jgi:hypothetical protein